MRRLVSSIHTSLDGYVAGPHGELDWLVGDLDPQAESDLAGLAAAAGTLLLGRVSYEGCASVWPTMTGRLAEAMDRLPKLVLSRTGTPGPVGWGDRDNAELVAGPAADTVRTLKQQDGADLLVLASATLVQSLTVARLIDEYRICVHPVVLGAGHALFAGTDRLGLSLAGSMAYRNGCVLLTYRLL